MVQSDGAGGRLSFWENLRKHHPVGNSGHLAHPLRTRPAPRRRPRRSADGLGSSLPPLSLRYLRARLRRLPSPLALSPSGSLS